MYKYFSTLLLASVPLPGSTDVAQFEDQSCYPYSINPPVINDCGWNYGLHADFLYWKPYVDDNSFATVQNAGYYGPNTLLVIATPSPVFVLEIDPPYEWNEGVRVGLHAGLPENGWTLAADWTHFVSHHENKFVRIAPGPRITSGTGTTLSAIFDNPIVTLSYLQDPAFYDSFADLNFSPSTIDSSAAGNWKIHYDTINLTLARAFYVGRKVTLTPYGGAKALFLQQSLHSNASASWMFGNPDVPNLIGNSVMTLTQSSQFNGIGLQAGLRSTWEVMCHFGIYSDASASILYGKSKSTFTGKLQQSFTSDGFGTPALVNYSAKKDMYSLKATLDLALGIEWRKNLFSENSLFSLRMGWEEHLLFRQNTFIEMDVDYQTIHVAKRSIKQRLTDVSFQGLVVSASLDY